jgi:hypothetical protein
VSGVQALKLFPFPERKSENSFFPKSFSVNYASREYREEFSKAYKILYKEGNLCYLTEILDSAQEG